MLLKLCVNQLVICKQIKNLHVIRTSLVQFLNFFFFFENYAFCTKTNNIFTSLQSTKTNNILKTTLVQLNSDTPTHCLCPLEKNDSLLVSLSLSLSTSLSHTYTQPCRATHRRGQNSRQNPSPKLAVLGFHPNVVTLSLIGSFRSAISYHQRRRRVLSNKYING